MNTNRSWRNQELRKGRHSIQGTYYHLITATYKRRAILANDTAASIIYTAFSWSEEHDRIKWQCIMIMPDHLHTVFQLVSTHNLSKVIHSIKRFTAREYNKRLRNVGHLWQRGYSDFGIRNDEELNRTIRYCYENPVRKGLVSRPSEYPYWKCKYTME